MCWAYGTYSVDGDRIEWSVLDGGGISPNNAANKPGERFVFEWSRYRDTLTLTAVPAEISPTPYMVEPWRLTDEASSSTALFGSVLPTSDRGGRGIDRRNGSGLVDRRDVEISLTRDELAAAGASDDEIADPISWGSWQLVLDGGEFSFVEPSTGANDQHRHVCRRRR